MDADAVANVRELIGRELWVFSVAAGVRSNAMVATLFMQDTIVPDIARVSIGVAQQHLARELVDAGGAFALHLIDESQHDSMWRFGLQSDRDFDKLGGLHVIRGTIGCPILSDSLASLQFRVETHMDSGDRKAYLADVHAAAGRVKTQPRTVNKMLEIAPPDRAQQMIARCVAIAKST